ncbi:unnamed protein product [Closterium sp. Naga37s-1]|nr:unnamed protein product [Closterium sp. Naga37s-1]
MGVPLLLDVLRKPATTLVVALCSFIWFQIQKRAIRYPDVGISYDAVVSHRQFWRLASAPLSHISLLHLLFNVSALWSMGGIETLTSPDISKVAVMATGGAAGNATSSQWQSAVSSVPLAPSSPSSLPSSSFPSSSQPSSSLAQSIPHSSISGSLTGPSNSSTEPSEPVESTATAAVARRGLGENANAGPIQGQKQQNSADESDWKQQQQQQGDKAGLPTNEQHLAAAGWEPGGSIGYLRDSFLMLVLSGLLGLAMYHVLIHRWRLEYFRRVTAVGYSCVVFGWMTVLSVRRPTITLSVFGLIKLPVSLAPFESLIFTSFIVPKGGVYGAVLGVLGYYSKESELIRGANALYKAVTRQADDEMFLRALGLPSQFRTHHALLVLHTWLALLRLRKEGAQGAAVGQTFYDTFNHDVERRVVAAGVKMLVSKWMRELERSFYGAAAAYDAAVAPGASADALPKALWRNVFAEDASDMPSGLAAAPVQALTRYVRLELASLALTGEVRLVKGTTPRTNILGYSPSLPAALKSLLRILISDFNIAHTNILDYSPSLPAAAAAELAAVELSSACLSPVPLSLHFL